MGEDAAAAYERFVTHYARQRDRARPGTTVRWFHLDDCGDPSQGPPICEGHDEPPTLEQVVEAGQENLALREVEVP